MFEIRAIASIILSRVHREIQVTEYYCSRVGYLLFFFLSVITTKEGLLSYLSAMSYSPMDVLFIILVIHYYFLRNINSNNKAVGCVAVLRPRAVIEEENYESRLQYTLLSALLNGKKFCLIS